LTWLRSFDNPIVIAIQLQNEKVWLTVKKLDRHPQFIPTRIITDLPKPGKLYDTTEMIDVEKYLLRQPDRSANIIVDEIKTLSARKWNEVMLVKANYWTRSPTQESFRLDGFQWIIEAHSLDAYWLVDRWSPDDEYKSAGPFISLN
jgi:hypothetical protein